MENSTNEQHWKLLVLTLKGIAEHKGYSFYQIANRAGLTQINITRIFELKYCPSLSVFLQIAKAVGVNFFFEDKDGTTELNEIFEKAMQQLGRRPNELPKN